MNLHYFKTKFGNMAIAFNSKNKIEKIFMPVKNLSELKKQVSNELSKYEVYNKLPKNLEALKTQIQNHLNGKLPSYKIKDFNLDVLTIFQKKVLLKTFKVPFSKTCTYSDIAQKIGSTKAVRAVGTALGKNPFPLVFPCHRVLGKDGKMRGFSAPGGVETKEDLINLEKST